MSANVVGCISELETYTISEAAKRLGLSYWGLRVARKNGLRTIQVGRRAYVRGRDIVSYLEARAERQQGTETNV